MRHARDGCTTFAARVSFQHENNARSLIRTLSIRAECTDKTRQRKLGRDIILRYNERQAMNETPEIDNISISGYHTLQQPNRDPAHIFTFSREVAVHEK